MFIKINPVKQRAVVKHLQKKSMTPSQIHEDMVTTSIESAVDIVKRQYHHFKSRRTSCKSQHAIGQPTNSNSKKVHNIVLQDQWVRIKDIVDNTGLSYHVVQHILTKALDMKKMSARCVPQMLTLIKKYQMLKCDHLF